jgi:hypothetical protein
MVGWTPQITEDGLNKKELANVAVIAGVGIAAAAVLWLVLSGTFSTIANGFAKPKTVPPTNTSSIGSVVQGVLGVIGQVQNSNLQNPTQLPQTNPLAVDVGSPPDSSLQDFVSGDSD